MAVDDMTLQQFADAWRAAPTAFANAFEEASRGAMIGFWKEFRRQIPLRSRPARGSKTPPLKSSAAWPIVSSGNSLETLEVSMFTESDAATLFEFGGTVRPKSGESIAIPIGASRTRTGGVKPYYSKPEKRRKRGDVFILLKRGGVRYLHKLVQVKKRKRGRPRRDARGTPLKPSASPYYLLIDSVDVRGQLGFYSTWQRYWPTAVFRWHHNVECAIKLLLGQPVPARCRRWLERRGGSLQKVNRDAA